MDTQYAFSRVTAAPAALLEEAGLSRVGGGKASPWAREAQALDAPTRQAGAEVAVTHGWGRVKWVLERWMGGRWGVNPWLGPSQRLNCEEKQRR